jgi:hypothetical protein
MLRYSLPLLLTALVLPAPLSQLAAVSPPPLPPPQSDDPVVAKAIKDAQACFFGPNWDRSSDLRFKAEAAERNLIGNPGQSNWDNVRDIVVDYEKSRIVLEKCISEFREFEPQSAGTANTKAAFRFQLSWMDENYTGQ